MQVAAVVLFDFGQQFEVETDLHRIIEFGHVEILEDLVDPWAHGVALQEDPGVVWIFDRLPDVGDRDIEAAG